MSPLKFVIILTSSFILFCVAFGLYIMFSVSDGLPSLAQLENPRQNFATQILSSDGEILDHFFIQRRVSLPIDSIPKDFQHALVAVEDRNFYNHWGVHTARVIQALVKNILTMRTKEGASTITMQLALNLYFTRENNLKRKIKEAITAFQIEKTYTKEEILELYANTVSYGRGAYGIQVASQVYFDKSPMELTTSECAFLVGLLKAPEHYNSILNYDKSINRRNLVLNLMHEQGYLNTTQYNRAVNEPIILAAGKSKIKNYMLAPHFVEMIRQQLSKDSKLQSYDLYRDGLRIYTTLDSRIQRYAEEAVSEHLAQYQETFNKSWSWSKNRELLEDLIKKAIRDRAEYKNASARAKSDISSSLRKNKTFIDSIKNAATTIQIGLTVIDPASGAILAMVGASPKFIKDHRAAKYSINHATQILRQPGSSFKPFVYASALQHGLDPTSKIECGPFSYTLPSGEVWSPRGTGKCGAGESVTLRQALVSSINTVSARLITQVTTPLNVISLTRKMGIESPLKAVPALSLGAGGEVKPIEMTSAYGTFVNQGIYVEPYSVSKIEEQFGAVIYEKKRINKATDVLSQDVANKMTSMMKDVVDYGTGRNIRNYFPVIEAAGKTGTTNDFADAWFVGFTPQLVAGIWVGFDEHRVSFTGDYGYAAQAAAPIWGKLMAKIYNNPTLPYKQKSFAIAKTDSLDSNLIIDENDDIPIENAFNNTNAQTKQPNKQNKTIKQVKPENKSLQAILPKLPKQNETEDKKKHY